GLRHLRLFGERGDITTEVCDIRPEGLAEAAAIAPPSRQWKNYSDALATKPEIVLIATPPSSHASLTRAAMEAGAHVFCEKPMADSLEASRSMLIAEQRTGRLLNIGFAQRFMPELQRVRKLIQQGVIGDVSYACYSVSTLTTLECSRSRHQRSVFGSAA